LGRLKTGLVLGGGGARGLAHIGVLKTLQKYNLPVDVVVGTSMGALVGGVFAQHPDASFVAEKFDRFLHSDAFDSVGGVFFRKRRSYEPDDLLQHISKLIKRRVVINLAAYRQSILKGERLEIAVGSLLDDGRIEQTAIPFACAAVDLKSGQEIIFDKGDIRLAVKASSSIPGFLPPVQYENYHLVDGSVCSNFPIQAARALGAEFIIVSNVSAAIDENQTLDNVVDIIIRAQSAATNKINQLSLRSADFILEPAVANVVWNEFEHVDSIIEQGRIETEKSIVALKKAFKKESGVVGRTQRWVVHKLQRTMNCMD